MLLAFVLGCGGEAQAVSDGGGASSVGATGDGGSREDGSSGTSLDATAGDAELGNDRAASDSGDVDAPSLLDVGTVEIGPGPEMESGLADAPGANDGSNDEGLDANQDAQQFAQDSAAGDADMDASAGTGGTYLTVTGSSPLAGTYPVSDQNSSCGGNGVFSITNTCTAGDVTVEIIGVVLDAGETVMSPKVRVVPQFGTVDDGTYPVGVQGSCTVTDESGQWPQIDARFVCTGLVGIGSGQPFALSGDVRCP
jgi:hypothetical protein